MARIEKYSFTSGGAAYTLEIGFEPDTIEVWNYTQWAVDTKVAKSYWHKGMTTAYALNEVCEDTSTNHSTSTSNGFTVLTTTSWVDISKTITGATAVGTTSVDLTITSHGWTASNNGNKLRIRDVVGMTELNDNLYTMTYLDANSILIEVDGSGFTSYSSGGTAYNVSEKVYATGSYRVTLGTDIVGADSDVMYVEARQADNSTSALGDIG